MVLLTVHRVNAVREGRWHRVWGAWLPVMVAAAWGTALSPHGMPPQVGGPEAAVAGQVVGAPGGLPTAEVVVTVTGEGGATRVMVDSRGRFAVSGLRPGTYILTAEKPGYAPGAFGRMRPRGDGQPLHLVAGRTANATLTVWKLAAVGGRVIDEWGDPVAGASVRALRRTWLPGRSFFSAEGGVEATSDDRGAYRLAGLVPGEYLVVVPVRLTTVPVAVLVRATTDAATRSAIFTVTSELPPLGDPRSQQAGDFAVLASSGTPIAPAAAAPDVLHVYPTTFFPSASSTGDAGVVSLAAGEDRSDVQIVLRPLAASTVSGRFDPDTEGGPARLASVKLVPVDGSVLWDTSGLETASGVTDEAGRFTLLGVPPGRYTIQGSSQGDPRTSSTRPTQWGSQEIVVGGHHVVDVVVRPARLTTVTGRVERHGAAAAAAAVTMSFESVGPASARVHTVLAGMSASFSAQVPPGRYLVRATASDGVWCPTVSLGDVEVSDAPIDLAGDEVSGILARCGGSPSRLRGVVRSAAGEPDSTASVIVFPSDGRYRFGPEARPARFGQVRAGLSGDYMLVNLPAGDYVAVAIPDALADVWQGERTLQHLARVGVRVGIAAGETLSLDLRTTVVAR